ncbi:MAG: hypothetical protein K2N37_07385, partial [Lachnospiraceae bacterium]|nr:hypothetical protein [Lachnospiraceae bacterium]
MGRIYVSGRLTKRAGIILCAAVMLAAAIVMPVKADEGDIELRYEPSGTMKEIAPEETEVGKHGKLSIADVDGYTAPVVVDKDRKPYQLRGVSTHGLSWFPQYV